MFAENPEVAGHCDRVAGQIRNRIRIRKLLDLSRLQDLRQSHLPESGELEIKMGLAEGSGSHFNFSGVNGNFYSYDTDHQLSHLQRSG
ncbi:MAG: hypothetical protein H6Q05_3570 [Acidobacteria bacterium]|nr:hypothetical protein [Acidobacteriota bacterium]